MYLLAPFILQNFKKILRADPELWGCANFRPKMANFSRTNFFWYKPLLLLSSTYWPFSLSKILKNYYSRSRVIRMCHFWGQNGPFVMNKKFLVQTIIITFIYLLALFIVQNFKKLLQPIQSYEDVPFSGPKWPICHEQFLFGTNHYYYFHLPTGPFHCPKF